MVTSDDVEIRHNPERRQFEAWAGDELAGRAEFGLADGVIVFTHTVVEERFQGRGIASALIKHALDHVRARGELSVVARCPMVKAWIEHHRDYQDLLLRSRRTSHAGHSATES